MPNAACVGQAVRHVHVANLTLAHTSAQFFLPHEETSGGDYAITRSAAVFAENASALVIQGNTLQHIGGNGVFLSNSVSNVSILQNRFSYLGTSGVLIVGRTGRAMMDARDGEAMAAKAGGKDNGVRLPKHNVVSQNVFSDYGVWDKQSAAFHKALAPGNTFEFNVVFNSSRHGVNFQGWSRNHTLKTSLPRCRVALLPKWKTQTCVTRCIGRFDGRRGLGAPQCVLQSESRDDRHGGAQFLGAARVRVL